MTTVAEAVTIRAAAPDDEPAILRLLTETMAGGPTGERSAVFYRWKHHDNPFGRSLALVAEIGGEIAGLRMFMRWRFVRQGHHATAVRAVDTATHPRFQGRGVFTRLTTVALTQAERDTDLVFNTPNANSLPGYLKMGWTPVGRIPIALRIVRPVAFVRGVRQAGHGAPSTPPPPIDLPAAADVLEETVAVQTLLDASGQPDDRLRTDRSAGYLRWRYAQAPGLDYRAVALWEGADLVGLAIGRPRRRGALAEFTLCEVIVRAGDRQRARWLLRDVASCGVDHVATHLVGWPTADSVRRSSAFLTAPRQGMALVARPFNDDLDARTLDNWALSLGDLEVF